MYLFIIKLWLQIYHQNSAKSFSSPNLCRRQTNSLSRSIKRCCKNFCVQDVFSLVKLFSVLGGEVLEARVVRARRQRVASGGGAAKHGKWRRPPPWHWRARAGEGDARAAQPEERGVVVAPRPPTPLQTPISVAKPKLS